VKEDGAALRHRLLGYPVLIAAGFVYTSRRINSVEACLEELKTIRAGLEEIKSQAQRANETITRTQGNMSMGFDRLAESTFRQLEALYSVYLDLGLKSSLPPTRKWAASPDLLKQLATYALQAKPKVIVECGSGRRNGVRLLPAMLGISKIMHTRPATDAGLAV